MNTYDYWKKRAFELENSSFVKSEETIKRLNASYLRIAKNLRDEINKIQNKIDRTNIIFLDDVQAYKYRQKLLIELKNKIYDEYRDLSQEEINITTKHYKDVIENTYKNISDYIGSIKTDASFSMLKIDNIKDLLSMKWLGENYSNRVWKNTNLLASKMSEILLDGIVSGKSIYNMSEQINKIMKVGIFNCERLIRTETSFFHNRASLKAYSDYGIEKYEYLATIDSRTSNICAKLNGQIFDVNKARTGLNYPPMHPFCRSTTIAYFEEGQLQQDDKGSIIKEKIDEDIDLHSVGRLQNRVYKYNFKDLVTDEVVITDKQIEHIEERRKGFYEIYSKYFEEIINYPDIIFEDNKNRNTLLVCKEIIENNIKVCIVLRLILSDDNPNFKNSIITAHPIGKRNFNKYLRTKKIIYKKE